MKEKNIGVGVHYLAIPEHPFYKKEFSWEPEDFPVAIQYGKETVSLPISAALTDQDLQDVVDAVRKTVER